MAPAREGKKEAPMTDIDVIQAHREGRTGGRWYPEPGYEVHCAMCNRGADRIRGGVVVICNVPLHHACAEGYFRSLNVGGER
jgi:hypothetical protein